MLGGWEVEWMDGWMGGCGGKIKVGFEGWGFVRVEESGEWREGYATMGFLYIYIRKEYV